MWKVTSNNLITFKSLKSGLVWSEKLMAFFCNTKRGCKEVW